MPPRHTYWTIILEGKPTAFRAHTQEELLPTLKQLQARHPDAVMSWFARGQLWHSQEEERRRSGPERPRGRTSRTRLAAGWHARGSARALQHPARREAPAFPRPAVPRCPDDRRAPVDKPRRGRTAGRGATQTQPLRRPAKTASIRDGSRRSARGRRRRNIGARGRAAGDRPSQAGGDRGGNPSDRGRPGGG